MASRLRSATAGDGFENLMTLAGADKSAATLRSVRWGRVVQVQCDVQGSAFDAGDLVGSDRCGCRGDAAANAERYIPVEVRLDFYAFRRLTEKSVNRQDRIPGSDTANNVKTNAAKLAADG